MGANKPRNSHWLPPMLLALCKQRYSCFVGLVVVGCGSFVPKGNIKDNLMIGYGRGGGGGGFGGFPYRSSHQQGQDGGSGRSRQRGRGGSRGGRSRRRTKSGVSYQAELQIPQELRRLIVGRGGSTLRLLRDSTGCKIFVPPQSSNSGNEQRRRNGGHQGESQESDVNTNVTTPSSTRVDSDNEDARNNAVHQQPHHPVRVNTNELSNLLHSFHDISCILPKANENATSGSIPCIVKMRSNDNKSSSTEVNVSGHLFVGDRGDFQGEPSNQQMLLFKGAIQNTAGSNESNTTQCSTDTQQPLQQHLCAYSIQTPLSEEDVSIAIDNSRFVDSSVVDSCQCFYRRLEPSLGRRSNSDTNNGSNTNSNQTDAQLGDDGDENDDAQRNSIECYSLVLVFGLESDNPYLLCQAIENAVP